MYITFSTNIPKRSLFIGVRRRRRRRTTTTTTTTAAATTTTTTTTTTMTISRFLHAFLASNVIGYSPGME